MKEKFEFLERLFWLGPSVLLAAERCGTDGDSVSSKLDAANNSFAKESRRSALEGAEAIIFPNRNFAFPKIVCEAS